MEEWFMNKSFDISMKYGDDLHTIHVDECNDISIDDNNIVIDTNVGIFEFKGDIDFTNADDWQVVVKTTTGEILFAE